MALSTRRFNTDFAASGGDLGDLYPTGVTMPAGYAPSADKDVATKDYVTGYAEPVDATILKQADVDDTPVNGVTTAPVSSNWAYDHANGTTDQHPAADVTFDDTSVDYTATTVQAALEEGEVPNYLAGLKSSGILTVYASDLDSLTTDGIYTFLPASVTNEPADMANAYAILSVYAQDATNSLQIIHGLGSTNIGHIWSRARVSSSWGSWIKVTDADNISFDDTNVDYTATTVQAALEANDFSSYIEGFNTTLPQVLSYASDLDSVVNNTIYRIYTDCTNYPSGMTTYSFLFCWRMSGIVLQQVKEYTTGRIWHRSSGNGGGAWSSWVEITDASNINYDNATSGLTATDTQSAIDEAVGVEDTTTGNVFVALGDYDGALGTLAEVLSDIDSRLTALEP